MAPGQLSYAEVRHLYRFNRIDKDTQVYGVIGDPIAQSKSPLIHNAAFRKLGLNSVYLPLRIPADLLQESLKEYDRLGLAGYSVTIPHKEGAIQFAANMDEDTDLMGAANTLFKREGVWCATNTDAPAALEAIQLGLKNAGAIPDLVGRKVLILGSGGAARAGAGRRWGRGLRLSRLSGGGRAAGRGGGCRGGAGRDRDERIDAWMALILGDLPFNGEVGNLRRPCCFSRAVPDRGGFQDGDKRLS